ncbi:hypothetical protein V6N11_001339 [Hibiscus sabdariffa]|uniref:Uncharacterized protein n=1 Tax=Hibiscus sabdariffa TaxID=183260 RepID=A0ABR2RZF9_9ROSI
MSSVVDDNQHREPIYDSSPLSLEKCFSFSSVSTNTLAEISEMGLPLTLVRSTDEEPKAHGKTTEQSANSSEEMHVGPPGVSSSSHDQNVVEYFSPNVGSSSSDEGLENVVSLPNKEKSFTRNQVNLPSLASKTTLVVDRRMGEVLDSSPKEDMKTRTNAVLPVLEARSAEDTNLAFKQLHERVDVEELIVPSMIEKPQDRGEIKSKLPVVEARSLKDIHKAFQQHSESGPAELPPSSSYTKVGNNVVLSILEARSAKDIDLAFKQLHEGVDVEEIIVPSMIEKLQDHADNKAKLLVVEARSLDDIDIVFQQAPESSPAELPHSSCLKKESSKDTKTQTNVVLSVLETKSAEDIDLALKQLREGVDVEEVIVPSMIERQQDYGDIQ